MSHYCLVGGKLPPLGGSKESVHDPKIRLRFGAPGGIFSG